MRRGQIPGMLNFVATEFGGSNKLYNYKLQYKKDEKGMKPDCWQGQLPFGKHIGRAVAGVVLVWFAFDDETIRSYEFPL